MIERVARNPLLLAGGFMLSALLGAAVYSGIERLWAPPPAGGEGVRAYLLEHPEVLPEAMDRLRERETAKAIAPMRSMIVDPYPGAVEGNPNGDVTIAAYLDYACGFCRANLAALAQLLKDDPKIKVVYREYPVLGEDSVVAARWALAAAEQGKFQAFHHALYAEAHPDAPGIAAAATKAGVDKAKAEAMLKAPRVDDELTKNYRVAKQLGVTGTPAWVIGNRVLYGLQDYDQLAGAVAAARAGK